MSRVVRIIVIIFQLIHNRDGCFDTLRQTVVARTKLLKFEINVPVVMVTVS